MNDANGWCSDTQKIEAGTSSQLQAEEPFNGDIEPDKERAAASPISVQCFEVANPNG